MLGDVIEKLERERKMRYWNSQMEQNVLSQMIKN